MTPTLPIPTATPDVRVHPNAFSQSSIDAAVTHYEERTGKKANGAVVVYADWEQGGTMRFGVVARKGEHLTFSGNLEHAPTKKWKGSAEVAFAW